MPKFRQGQWVAKLTSYGGLLVGKITDLWIRPADGRPGSQPGYIYRVNLDDTHYTMAIEEALCEPKDLYGYLTTLEKK